MYISIYIWVWYAFNKIKGIFPPPLSRYLIGVLSVKRGGGEKRFRINTLSARASIIRYDAWTATGTGKRGGFNFRTGKQCRKSAINNKKYSWGPLRRRERGCENTTLTDSSKLMVICCSTEKRKINSKPRALKPLFVFKEFIYDPGAAGQSNIIFVWKRAKRKKKIPRNVLLGYWALISM